MLCLVRNGVPSVFAGSLAVLAVLSTSARSALAEPIFFGPTPYVSSADSPFDLSGLGTTMFLEDFEDGELNTPGVSHLGTALVRSPSFVTDSVDADDGQIDGWGSDGHSAASTDQVCTDGDPGSCLSSIAFFFDTDVLGGLPTAVGIVWTDGAAGDRTGFRIFDENLQFVAGIGSSLGDTDSLGGTAEDRFLGVIDPDGIHAIQLIAGPIGAPIEVDHLQYGFFVPEPSAFFLMCVSISLFLVLVRRRLKANG